MAPTELEQQVARQAVRLEVLGGLLLVGLRPQPALAYGVIDEVLPAK